MRVESASQYSGSSRIEFGAYRLARAMDVLAHRRWRNVEHGCHLLYVESALDDEIETPALHVGQLPDDSCYPIECIARGGELRRIGRPGLRRPPRPQQPAATRGAPSIFRGRAPDDAVEPRPHGLALPKRRGPIERDHERFGHDILRVVCITDQLPGE